LSRLSSQQRHHHQEISIMTVTSDLLTIKHALKFEHLIQYLKSNKPYERFESQGVRVNQKQIQR